MFGPIPIIGSHRTWSSTGPSVDTQVVRGSVILDNNGFNSTYDVTGLPGEPTAVLIDIAEIRSVDTAVLHTTGGRGFAVNGGSQHGVGFYKSDDGTEARRNQEADAVVLPHSTDTVHRMSVSSWNADGFTLLDETAGDWTDIVLHYTAFIGADVQASVGATTMGTGSVTGLAFSPDLLFGVSHFSGNLGGDDGRSSHGSGVCAADLSQWSHMVRNDAENSLTSVWSYVRSGKFLDANESDSDMTIGSVTSDGFTWDTTGLGTVHFIYFALNLGGIGVDVGTFSKDTGANGVVQAVPDLGFTPQVLGLQSSGHADPGFGNTSDAVYCVGGANSDLVQSSYGTYRPNTAENGDQRVSRSRALEILDVDAAVLASGEVTDMSDSTPDITWNINDSRASTIGYSAVELYPSTGIDVKSEVVTFTTRTTTGVQTVSTSFTPKGVRLYWTAVSDELANNAVSYGFGMTDGTNQAAFASAISDTETDGWRRNPTTSVLQILDNAAISTVAVEASISAFNANSFDLNYGTADGTAYHVTAVVMGGADYEAVVGTAASDGGSVTGLGLSGNPAIHAGYIGKFNDDSDSECQLSFGVCDPSLNQWAYGQYMFATSGDRKGWLTSGAFFTKPETGEEMSVTSITSDGFDFTWTSSVAGDFAYMAEYYGGLPSTADVVTKTTTSTAGQVQSLSSLGWPSQIAMFASDGETSAPAALTDNNDPELSLGICDRTRVQAVLSWQGEDAATEGYQQRIDLDKAVGVLDTAAAYVALGSITSMSDPIKVTWDPNDALAYRIGRFAVKAS